MSDTRNDGSPKALDDKDVRKHILKALELMEERGIAKDRLDALELLWEAADETFVWGLRERVQPYQRYLQTRHWDRTRREALERSRHACALCGSGERLQVHHKTYQRIGREHPDDLIVLCRSCHAKFHDKVV